MNNNSINARTSKPRIVDTTGANREKVRKAESASDRPNIVFRIKKSTETSRELDALERLQAKKKQSQFIGHASDDTSYDQKKATDAARKLADKLNRAGTYKKKQELFEINIDDNLPSISQTSSPGWGKISGGGAVAYLSGFGIAAVIRTLISLRNPIAGAVVGYQLAAVLHKIFTEPLVGTLVQELGGFYGGPDSSFAEDVATAMAIKAVVDRTSKDAVLMDEALDKLRTDHLESIRKRLLAKARKARPEKRLEHLERRVRADLERRFGNLPVEELARRASIRRLASDDMAFMAFLAIYTATIPGGALLRQMNPANADEYGLAFMGLALDLIGGTVAGMLTMIFQQRWRHSYQAVPSVAPGRKHIKALRRDRIEHYKKVKKELQKRIEQCIALRTSGSVNISPKDLAIVKDGEKNLKAKLAQVERKLEKLSKPAMSRHISKFASVMAAATGSVNAIKKTAVGDGSRLLLGGRGGIGQIVKVSGHTVRNSFVTSIAMGLSIAALLIHDGDFTSQESSEADWAYSLIVGLTPLLFIGAWVLRNQLFESVSLWIAAFIAYRFRDPNKEYPEDNPPKRDQGNGANAESSTARRAVQRLIIETPDASGESDADTGDSSSSSDSRGGRSVEGRDLHPSGGSSSSSTSTDGSGSASFEGAEDTGDVSIPIPALPSDRSAESTSTAVGSSSTADVEDRGSGRVWTFDEIQLKLAKLLGEFYGEEREVPKLAKEWKEVERQLERDAVKDVRAMFECFGLLKQTTEAVVLNPIKALKYFNNLDIDWIIGLWEGGKLEGSEAGALLQAKAELLDSPHLKVSHWIEVLRTLQGKLAHAREADPYREAQGRVCNEISNLLLGIEDVTLDFRRSVWESIRALNVLPERCDRELQDVETMRILESSDSTSVVSIMRELKPTFRSEIEKALEFVRGDKREGGGLNERETVEYLAGVAIEAGATQHELNSMWLTAGAESLISGQTALNLYDGGLDREKLLELVDESNN